MNWCMLANELIQHSRNTSIATAVNRKSTTTSINLYLITLTVTGNKAQQTGTAEREPGELYMSLIRKPYMKHIFKALISHHLGFLHNPPPIPNIH